MSRRAAGSCRRRTAPVVRAETDRIARDAVVAAGVVPAVGEWTAGEAARVVPGLLERLRVQGGGRGVVEDEDVVRLDIEPPDAEVRGAAQYLQGDVALPLDHHLVVGEALEVSDLDIRALGGEPGLRL